jgi:glycosyltransferase involved in cell wall biosynthesis
MKKIKVLHLITHMGFGGSQDNTLITAEGHSRKRYEVHLAFGPAYTAWEARARACADAVFIIPDLCRAVKPRADIRALNHLTDFIRKQNYHIVHTHCAKAGTLGRIAARRAKVPIIIHTFHCFGWKVTRINFTRLWHPYTFFFKKWFYILVERYAASLSDALITVSELNKQEAINVKLAPFEKFTTIYSGIDFSL